MALFRSPVTFLLLTIATTVAVAQKPGASKPEPIATENNQTICFNVDSNYARITDFLPRVRESLAKGLSSKKKQLRAISLDVSPENAFQAATNKSCGYLLEMTVTKTRTLGAAVSTKIAAGFSPDEARERQELQTIRIDYHLKSMKNDTVGAKDTDRVREGDNMTGWNSMAYETTVSRAVTRIAVGSLNKLAKK